MKIIAFNVFFFLTQSLVAQTASAILLKNNVCKGEYSVKEIFRFSNDEVREVLQVDTVVKSTILSYCEKPVYLVSKTDSAISLSDTFLDLYYPPNVAVSVFNEISTRSFGEKKLPVFRHFDYLIRHGGRIFCLDKETSRLRLITINACQEPALFTKLVRALKQQKEFEQVIAINCGGDQRDIIQW